MSYERLTLIQPRACLIVMADGSHVSHSDIGCTQQQFLTDIAKRLAAHVGSLDAGCPLHMVLAHGTELLCYDASETYSVLGLTR